MNWQESMRLDPLGGDRFRANVGEEWTSLQGAHGGVVAALAVTAAEQVLAHDVEPGGATPTLRAATFGYARGNTIGDLDLEVAVVRRGRTMVTSHVTVRQDGKPTTLGRLHHALARDGASFSELPPPASRPDGTVRVAFPPPMHLNNVETWLHPDTQPFAGGDHAEWIAWSRPLHGDTFDSAWLTMFGDWFPPSVFARDTAPSRAVTIEYTLQIHADAGRWDLGPDGYLATHVLTSHANDGFAVEDLTVHLPDGSVLATARQTRLAD